MAKKTIEIYVRVTKATGAKKDAAATATASPEEAIKFIRDNVKTK